SVHVYDATTGGQIGLITSGINAPTAIAGDTVNNRLFVTNWFIGTVSEYDAVTLAPINASFITGLGTPTAIALDGATLLIANYSDGGIAKFDAATGALVDGSFLVGPAFFAVKGLAVAALAVCAADYDHNGRVEPADIAVFINTWLGSRSAETFAGDFDGNWAVEPADVSLFVSTWFNALTSGC